MDYYKILYDYENNTNAGYIKISESSLNFDRYAVNESQPLGVDRILCEVEQENIGDFDYIANNLAWLIVSKKVRDLLIACNLGEHEFIQVVDAKNNEIVGFLVHCMNLLDALDENKSVCTKKKYSIDGTDYEHLSVIKYVIETEKVRNSDVFKLKKSNIPYFISETLKDQLVKSDVKGFDFLKVKTT